MALFKHPLTENVHQMLRMYAATADDRYLIYLKHYLLQNSTIFFTETDHENHTLFYHLLRLSQNAELALRLQVYSGLLKTLVQTDINPLVAIMKAGNPHCMEATLVLLRDAFKNAILTREEFYSILFNRDLGNKTPIETMIEANDPAILDAYFKTVYHFLTLSECMTFCNAPTHTGKTLIELLKSQGNPLLMAAYAHFLCNLHGKDSAYTLLVIQLAGKNIFQLDVDPAEANFYLGQAKVVFDLLEPPAPLPQPARPPAIHWSEHKLGLFAREIPPCDNGPVRSLTEEEEKIVSVGWLPTGLLDDEEKSQSFQLR